jgi:cell division protease FtsH
MVREFGLSPAVGPIGYGGGGLPHLGGDTPAEEAARRPYSEATQRVIDEEIARLVREAESRAVALLRDHRPALDELADLLVARETVDGAVVLDVLARHGTPVPGPPGGA